MIFKYILFLFLYGLDNVSTGTIPTKSEEPCKNINVVLFFACACEHPKDTSGVKALKMYEVARVKSTIPGEHSLEQKSSEVMHNPPCKELLKESLTSLVHFCQNVLGMRTAVVSVSNAEITNDISNSEPDIPAEIRERHFSLSDFQNPEKAFLQPPAGQKPARAPVLKNLRDIITSPEHTEVFKIRVKRQSPEMERPSEIVNVPLEKDDKKHPWDVLDIMSHIRYSFFGKLLEDEDKKKLSEEENKIADDLSKNRQDPGLFETVKTTLNTLQDQTEAPFLMAIFGGHLSEVSNCKSPLMQSIKHVIENTNPKRTLIVLTSSCPEHPVEQEHHHEHVEPVQPVEHVAPAEHTAHGEHEDAPCQPPAEPVEHFEHARPVEPVEHNMEHVVPAEHVEHAEHVVHGEQGPYHEHYVCPHRHANGREHEYTHVQERALGFRRGYSRHRKRQEQAEERVVHIEEGAHGGHQENAHGGHQENATIPVFARGPEYTKLEQCSLLFDVPVVVKSILEQFALTFEGQPRSKRSVFGDIRMNKANYENVGVQVAGYQSVLFNLFIFVLFII